MYHFKMTELSGITRGGIVTLEKAGYSHTEIGKILAIPSSSVSTTVRCYKTTGSAYSAPRAGRPEHFDRSRRVLRAIENQPNHPWKDYGANFNVSPQNISRVAHTDGLHKRHAPSKPFLTAAQVTKRLDWACANSQTNWSNVVFTDEAAVETWEKKGSSWTIRRVGEEFMLKHLVPTFRQERKTLMIWDAIAYSKKWPLVRLDYDPAYDLEGRKGRVNRVDYINLILEGHLAGFVSEMRRKGRHGVTVVEDGAKIHDNKLAYQAREELFIDSQYHPPNSPDLNAIERFGTF